MAWSYVWLAGIVAFGTQWPVIDLPYPEVPEGGGAVPAAPCPEKAVEAAVRWHAARIDPEADITQVRIDGDRATALLTSPSRIEWVHLERSGNGWKVVQTFTHR